MEDLPASVMGWASPSPPGDVRRPRGTRPARPRARHGRVPAAAARAPRAVREPRARDRPTGSLVACDYVRSRPVRRASRGSLACTPSTARRQTRSPGRHRAGVGACAIRSRRSLPANKARSGGLVGIAKREPQQEAVELQSATDRCRRGPRDSGWRSPGTGPQRTRLPVQADLVLHGLEQRSGARRARLISSASSTW